MSSTVLSTCHRQIQVTYILTEKCMVKILKFRKKKYFISITISIHTSILFYILEKFGFIKSQKLHNHNHTAAYRTTPRIQYSSALRDTNMARKSLYLCIADGSVVKVHLVQEHCNSTGVTVMEARRAHSSKNETKEWPDLLCNIAYQPQGRRKN